MEPLVCISILQIGFITLLFAQLIYFLVIFKLLHPSKASGSTLVLLGIIIEVKLVQSLNADPHIFATLLGMVIEVKPVQPANALSPIYYTLLGMVIEVKPVQPSNALASIPVTLLGITVVLQPTINVLFLVLIIALQLSLES